MIPLDVAYFLIVVLAVFAALGKGLKSIPLSLISSLLLVLVGLYVLTSPLSFTTGYIESAINETATEVTYQYTAINTYGNNGISEAIGLVMLLSGAYLFLSQALDMLGGKYSILPR